MIIPQRECWNTPLFGINHVVNPEIEAARVVVKSIDWGAKSNILFFDQGDLQLSDVTIPEDSDFVGKPVRTIRAEVDSVFLIALLNRNDSYIIPSGDTVIYAGDQLFLLGSESELDAVLEINGRKRAAINRIAIAGGGKISRLYCRRPLQGKQSRGKLFQKDVQKDYPWKNPADSLY